MKREDLHRIIETKLYTAYKDFFEKQDISPDFYPSCTELIIQALEESKVITICDNKDLKDDTDDDETKYCGAV